ncbi:MAG TPA: glycerate kinase, partial [Solirubrobacterales bacterium]|nr:glycerate kinase [Solirubrobacterales bacterium]
EGRLDEQSLAGKLPGEIARRCRAAGVPLHAIVGQMALPPDGIRRLGFASAAEAGTPEAIADAAERIASLPHGGPAQPAA